MDKRIILYKLESLDRCIERLKSKKPSDIETFRTDHDLQDIIVLNLERAVQMCVDIASYIIAELEVRAPMTMSESFSHRDREKSPYFSRKNVQIWVNST